MASSSIKTLILVRGLPGAGKTIIARTLASNLHLSLGESRSNMSSAHLEEDMYFMKGGQYMYDSNKAHAAETWCLEAVRTAMEKEINLIVVSNVFARLYEVNLYTQLARAYKYNVQEIILNAPFESKKADADKIKKIQRNFQYRPKLAEIGQPYDVETNP